MNEHIRSDLAQPTAATNALPGRRHHVTQRGNRRQPVFFSDGDYESYQALMAQWRQSRGWD